MLHEIFEDYNKRLVDPEHLSTILAHAEPGVLLSSDRHIGYISDETAYNPSKPNFDVIYKVIIMVRDNPLLLNMMEDNKEEYIRYLFASANELFQKWLAIAVDVWEGNETPAPDDPILQKTFSLPRKVGSPSITIFGLVLDQEGRGTSLTLTDQSNILEAYEKIPYAFWLYDEMTKAGMDHNFNAFGASPHYKTVVGEKIKPKRKKAVKKPTPKKSSSKKETVAPSITIAVSSKPKPNTAHCSTVEELKEIKEGELFTMDISHIAVARNKSLRFYGFTHNADNELISDTHNPVFLHEDRDGYNELVKALAEHNIVISEFPEDGVEVRLTIRGIKRIDRNKASYYTDISLA